MKKIYLFLLGIVCCAMSVEVGAQTRSEGERLFNEKRYEEAYKVYSSLMSSHTRDYVLRYQAARCLYELGRMDEAQKLFKKALEKGVEKANIFLAEIYFEEYRFSEASAALSAYIATLGEGQDSLLKIYNDRLEVMNLGASMLERVEDVAVVDSVKVHKSQLLMAYRLPRELGKLGWYNKDRDEQNGPLQLAYYTGRSDKMIFADKSDSVQLDLNTAYRLVEGWSEASNLSVVLNTQEDENYPFELPDGVTLYFASKGHNSLGGYDIFLTRYNSTIEDYSTPVNIGMPFNSPANDYFYVFDEMAHIGWFATDRFQHEDTVVVYEFVPNREKKLIKTEDDEYKRRAAQLRIYSKANLAVEEDSEDDEVNEKTATEIDFFVNDGIVYTQMAQFVSEDAKALYVESQDVDKRLLTLERLLEGKRREFFFAESEDDKNALRVEILELEKEVRKYKKLFDEYMLQIRREELKALTL